MTRVCSVLTTLLLTIALNATAQTPSATPANAESAPAKAQSQPSGPKVYRWVDAAGRVQFGSAPPQGLATEAVTVREQSLGRDPRADNALDVVDRRNKTAPAPSYDWDAERPKRLAEHCGFIRERVSELRAGNEWIVLDWGKAPTRLDGPRRVEELVKRERLLRQYCEGY